MPKHVLALDPGERVGWARAVVDDEGNWDECGHGITPLRDMAIALYHNIEKYDVVVCETWRLYPHMAQTMAGSSFPSVQFIGMVKLLCWIHNIELVMQGASIKTTALKTMRKHRNSLYLIVTKPRAHDSAHDMDALMHLWHYTWRTHETHACTAL